MVRLPTDDGKGFYHEPPYTEEEEADFYRRVGGGPVAILRGPKPAAATSPQLPPRPPRMKKRQ